jgi:hypothetical protein
VEVAPAWKDLTIRPEPNVLLLFQSQTQVGIITDAIIGVRKIMPMRRTLKVSLGSLEVTTVSPASPEVTVNHAPAVMVNLAPEVTMASPVPEGTMGSGVTEAQAAGVRLGMGMVL